MGMIITLCLISFNVYNAVDAPPSRGFSYIEVWMVGMEIPIIMALLEYSLILGFKRCSQNKAFGKFEIRFKIDQLAAKIDTVSFIISMTYFILFSISYWFYVNSTTITQ